MKKNIFTLVSGGIFIALIASGCSSGTPSVEEENKKAAALAADAKRHAEEQQGKPPVRQQAKP
jgi:hypothetical protein